MWRADREPFIEKAQTRTQGLVDAGRGVVSTKAPDRVRVEGYFGAMPERTKTHGLVDAGIRCPYKRRLASVWGKPENKHERRA